MFLSLKGSCLLVALRASAKCACFPLPPVQAYAYYVSLNTQQSNAASFAGWALFAVLSCGWNWLNLKFTATDSSIKELSDRTERNSKELEHTGKDVARLVDLISNERKDTKAGVAGLADLIRSERAESKSELRETKRQAAASVYFSFIITSLSVLWRHAPGS